MNIQIKKLIVVFLSALGGNLQFEIGSWGGLLVGAIFYMTALGLIDFWFIRKVNQRSNKK
ncbi:hypothetical protein LCGC14_1542630 [marine sediment metagenome]|uniref:Uncharacterized protein n=1 Tax=marine sediment metagenome TaxID=412755 RepID=A0A0F9L8P0_9ZZZZ